MGFFRHRRGEIVRVPIPPDLKTVLKRFHNKIETNCPVETADEERYTAILGRLRDYKKIDIKEHDYKEIVSLGLFIEEFQSQLDFEEYKCDVTIEKTKDDLTVEEVKQEYLALLGELGKKDHKEFYTIRLAKSFPADPPVMQKDFCMIFDKERLEEFFDLQIERVHTDYLIVGADSASKFNDFYKLTKKNFFVKFRPNTYTFDCCHYTLKRMDAHRLTHRLYPTMFTKYFLFPEKMTLNRQIVRDCNWFNKNIANNEEQKKAVISILNKSSYPAPFILYGPPGTGKTSTVVEAVLQILEKDHGNCKPFCAHKSKILICTPSNSAADTVAQRLIKSGVGNRLIRLYSASRDISTVDLDLIPHSNINRKAENIDFLMANKTIVICTLCYCTKLLLYEIHDFSYIFIDEAGQAKEPDALIPFNMNNDFHIILAGDPQQLGPVVKCKLAEPIIGTSLMERLMCRSIYKKDNDSYDSDYLVQLLNNYRSHPDIINVSNGLFYENALKSIGCHDDHISQLWAGTPEKFFPVVFHRVEGTECKVPPSPSLYNQKEIDVVVNYVKQLLGLRLNHQEIRAEDIGIITPFTLQSKKLQMRFEEENIRDVEVGTVELFQGREKDIVILSTVRSKVFYHDRLFHIGFLSNPKRVNVALTRAKALMIVIGNPNALKIDRNWLSLINTCIENKSCRGAPFAGKIQQPLHCLDVNRLSRNIISSNSLLHFVPRLVLPADHKELASSILSGVLTDVIGKCEEKKTPILDGFEKLEILIQRLMKNFGNL